MKQKTTTQRSDGADTPLVNRVAQSGLITFVLEDLAPDHEITSLDLAQFLWQGLVLREKEFRQALKEIEWSQYQGKTLCVYCGTDAIVPTWAFMLVAASSYDGTREVFFGNEEQYLTKWFAGKIANLDLEEYRDARIVVKGCAREKVPVSAYVDLVTRLQPVARSIMYGEPCSTVPIYKRPKL